MEATKYRIKVFESSNGVKSYTAQIFLDGDGDTVHKDYYGWKAIFLIFGSVLIGVVEEGIRLETIEEANKAIARHKEIEKEKEHKIEEKISYIPIE